MCCCFVGSRAAARESDYSAYSAVFTLKVSSITSAHAPRIAMWIDLI
jgi:hypothetical protein